MNIEQWDIKKIIPYDRNPRNNENAVNKVAISLEQYGWQQPIVVDKFGVVLVGHTRLKAAKQLGMSTCPVRVADDLSEAKAKAYRIMDNKSAEFSEWDQDLLGIEVQELMDLDFDIQFTGFNPDSFVFNDFEKEKNTDFEKPQCDEDVIPIKKFCVNKTRTARFFSIRRWSSSNKKQQVKYIQGKKKSLDIDFVNKVAGDFIEFISIFGDMRGYFITHAPAGNSVCNKFNLATEISKVISNKLNIEYLKIFSDFTRKTKNVCNYKDKRAIEIVEDVQDHSRIILVDDVATTGTTMEACISALNIYHIIPVVWVYSEVVNNE